MRTAIKVVLTFVIILVAEIILALIKAALGTHGGIGLFIIFPAEAAGIYAIWQWNPDKKGNSSDDETLTKS